MTTSQTETMRTVTLTLASASFVVDGKNDNELIENAKKAMAEQLAKGVFPQITYSITDVGSLTFENVYAGQIVEREDDGTLGIVTGVNTKTIHVTLINHRSLSTRPQYFKESKATFEEARSKRDESYKKMNFWTEGYSGYLKNKDGIHEVVVGKMTRGKAKLHIVNTRRYFSVPEDQLELLLKDDKAELE
ncbi:hypothetical protein [Psychrobacillus sp. FSL H8-0487]|uniref:hypothetical protein n=1 Tax=Psychrobacillus sp. FSL H8-0487 TaxID=2921391 RepID=UPI0030FD0C1E